MSPVTHFLTGWVIANAVPLDRRGRAIVTLSAVAPDVDGLGIIPESLTRHSQHPLLWFSEYHHALHTLWFAAIVAITAFLIAKRSWVTAGLAFLSFHVHLLQDLIGSRGPDGYVWPIPYLFPISQRCVWTWEGQWKLDAWQNIVITVALLAGTIFLAIRRGYSPVEMISSRVDNAVIAALRGRFRSSRKPA